MGLMQIMPETWADSRPLPPRRRSIRRARQHPRRCRLSPRDARSLRFSRLSRRLQCRAGALRRTSHERSAAACGDTGLRGGARAGDWRAAGRRPGAAFDLFAWLHAPLFPPHADPSSGRSFACSQSAAGSSPAVRRVVDLRRSPRVPKACSSACRGRRAAMMGLALDRTLEGLSQVWDWPTSAAGNPTTDGKIKAPPSVGRMWLVGLEIFGTSAIRPAGAFAKRSTISMLRAPSPCFGEALAAMTTRDDDCSPARPHPARQPGRQATEDLRRRGDAGREEGRPSRQDLRAERRLHGALDVRPRPARGAVSVLPIARPARRRS